MGIFPVEFRHNNLIIRGVVFEYLCRKTAGNISYLGDFEQKYYIFEKYENFGGIVSKIKFFAIFFPAIPSKISISLKIEKLQFLNII